MDRASLPVFLSVPFPAVNGITVYSINLARGLGRLGYPARILLTEVDTTLVTYDERVLEIPEDVPVERLPVSRLDGWGTRWGALIRHLHASAPCVYIPNSDYRHSVVSPALRPEVLVVGVAHADEPLHHDHVARLGEHWDAVVCVSRTVADRVRERLPGLAPRLVVIRNGIEMPAAYPGERTFDGPLRLVYHGAFKQQQKRILDFPELLRTIRRKGVDASLTLIGSGPDEMKLREAGRDLIAEGTLVVEPPVPNEILKQRLSAFDVYLLNSEFEGMPQALLEAMSRGCVPVISDVSGGAREIVRDRENGYVVGLGDFEAFAERLTRLDGDRARLASMSRRAFETLGELGIRLEQMARSYDELFVELVRGAGYPRAPRGAGPIASPPASVDGVSVFEVSLPVRDPARGSFPSWGDLEDFRWELIRQRGEALERLRGCPLWLALGRFDDSYESELALELGTALSGDGFDARLVGLRPPARAAGEPPGARLHTACPDPRADWPSAAARMLDLVGSCGECTYVALDRETAGLAPRLPVAVRTLMLANRGEVDWLRANDLPRHLDGLVLTALDAEAELFPQPPPASLLTATIPFPVYAQVGPIAARDDDPMTALVYLGHLDGLRPDWRAAKEVAAALAREDMPARLLLAGPAGSMEEVRGLAREASSGRLATEAVECANRRALHVRLRSSDLLVLPLAFPDASLVILDALAHGCLPVGIRSPGLEAAIPGDLAPDLVVENGAGGLARRVRELARSPERRRRLAEWARDATRASFPGPTDVVERWKRLLCLLWDATERADARRAPSPLVLPYEEPEMESAVGGGWRRALARLLRR